MQLFYIEVPNIFNWYWRLGDRDVDSKNLKKKLKFQTVYAKIQPVKKKQRHPCPHGIN